MLTAALAALFALGPAAAVGQNGTRNGYALAFPGLFTIAVIKTPLNPTTFASLEEGMSATAWARFDIIALDRWQHVILVGHDEDTIMFSPFAGAQGFYNFGTPVSDVVSTLGMNATCWHHYATTWNQSTGAMHFYIDGQEVNRNLRPVAYGGEGKRFLDKRPVVFLGSRCWLTSTNFYERTGFAGCDTENERNINFHGEMDDVALFAGVLTASEVATVRSQPIASSTLKPVLAWDFDASGVTDPSDTACSECPYAPNVGTTGSEYDMLLGRLPKDGIYSSNTVSVQDNNEIIPLLAPSRVPRSPADANAGPPGCGAAAPVNTAAPMVLVVDVAPSNFTSPPNVTVTTPAGAIRMVTGTSSQDAYASVSNMVDSDGLELRVEVLPWRPPMALSQTAVGDTLVAQQLLSAYSIEDMVAQTYPTFVNSLGSAAPFSIIMDSPPTRGTLWETAPQVAQLQVGQLNRTGQRMSRAISGLAFAPVSNENGRSYASFSYHAQSDGHETSLSQVDSIEVTIEPVDDLPVAYGAA